MLKRAQKEKVNMTTAPRENYKIDLKLCLQHCIEISNAQKLTTEEAKSNIKKAAFEIVRSGKTCFKQGDFFTTVTTLAPGAPFDFNSIHKDLTVPPAVEKYPLVVQVVMKEGVSDKVFVRVKTDLNYYDGVTSMNAGFQVAIKILDLILCSKT